jgi:hypothetical protein
MNKFAQQWCLSPQTAPVRPTVPNGSQNPSPGTISPTNLFTIGPDPRTIPTLHFMRSKRQVTGIFTVYPGHGVSSPLEHLSLRTPFAVRAESSSETDGARRVRGPDLIRYLCPVRSSQTAERDIMDEGNKKPRRTRRKKRLKWEEPRVIAITEIPEVLGECRAGNTADPNDHRNCHVGGIAFQSCTNGSFDWFR